ncbi:MAG: nucleoside deaminase [Aquificae bacterium]|nr:nucleoside deaminase [Aquificota bacterium]
MEEKRRLLLEALEEAKKAFEKGEVPVGCVIAKNGKVVARAHNRVEELSDPTAHAEILAIREAASKLGIKALRDCEIFVTLEPCPMCAGAVALAGFKKLYFGTENEKHGAVLTKFFLLEEYKIPWELLRCGECSELLKEFFRKLRREDDEKD